GQGEHLPAAQGGARQRDELLSERLHERGREGGHQGVQGEAAAGVAGAVRSLPTYVPRVPGYGNSPCAFSFCSAASSSTGVHDAPGDTRGAGRGSTSQTPVEVLR